MRAISIRFLQASLLCTGLFFFFLMVRLTLPYLSLRYDVDFLLTKQSVLHLTFWRYAFYTHITSSLVVLLAGILQFIPSILRQWPKLHRQIGKVYVFSILAISAPSGLVMALYASGGFWAKLSFACTSIFWWSFTWIALQKALQKNFLAHEAFMYRSFALTLSAITLRCYAWALPAFAHWHHLHGKEMYVCIAWLSWVPNLLLAEILLRKRSLHQ